nr:MAG TPA: YhhN family protein [Caudoviricetes sp.]
MPAAMALTLGADTFLLLLNDHYGAGVALFCGVQALYLVRICRRNGGRTLWPLRLVLVLGAWAGLWALGLLSPLNLLAAVYFTNFLLNACQAVPLHSPLFSVGLWLFLLCDVCVGIRNQPELFPGWLAAFAQVGMWLFYLPGQVLLVLSGRKEPTK